MLSSEKKPPGGGADALRLTSPGLANVTTQNMFLTRIVDARMHQDKGGARTIYVATEDVPWEAERNAQGDNKVVTHEMVWRGLAEVDQTGVGRETVCEQILHACGDSVTGAGAFTSCLPR